ncbi:MAG TPA: hypothetical protein VF006_02040 [Longimicrobium sp.]
MTIKINLPRLLPLALAAALFGAIPACTREQPVAPPGDAAAVAAARPYELVILEPVLVQNPGRGPRTEHRYRTVRLTPVMKGEAIDYSQPIFATAQRSH